MHDEIDGPRIARYLRGQGSASEATEIRKWLAEDPARARLVEELARVWEVASRDVDDWDVDDAWRNLVTARDDLTSAAAAIDEPADASITGDRRRANVAERPPRRWPTRAAAAAAVVLITGSSALAWHLTQRPDEPASAPVTEFATRPGQRAIVTFTDGTRVHLGVATTLRYSQAYGDETREVHLDGEAYFDVAHDSRRPFTVHTARAVARDLGTRFGVRAYADDDEVEVVVVEGVVDLRPASSPATAPADSVILNAADLGRLDRGGRLTVQHGVDAEALLAWRNGRLIFRDTPLRRALPRLSHWYDAELRLGDPAVGDYPLTASLRTEPLEQVIDMMVAALDLRIERRGEAILLFPARAR